MGEGAERGRVKIGLYYFKSLVIVKLLHCDDVKLPDTGV